MKFKKDPIKSPFKTKNTRITTGSDRIQESGGQFYLRSTGQKLIERKDLVEAALLKLEQAISLNKNKH